MNRSASKPRIVAVDGIWSARSLTGFLLACALCVSCGDGGTLSGGDDAFCEAEPCPEGTRSATSAAVTLNPVSGNNNQNQINQALAGGGVVHLNAGTYLISNTIKMTSGSTLEGDHGAIIKLVSSAGWPKNRAMIEGHGVSNVRITGFSIDGSQAQNGGHSMCGKYLYTMLYFTSSSYLEVDHMYMHDNLNDILKFTSSSNVKFHDNTVRKEGHDIVYAIKSKNVWVYNNDLRISCNSGIRPDGTKPIYIYNNEIASDGGGYAGIEIQGASEVWYCNNNIHDTAGPKVANLSGAPTHTSGCPSAGAPDFPSAGGSSGSSGGSAGGGTTQPAPATNGDLAAEWRFDETSGTIASDSSGGGHTGTIMGATRTVGVRGNGLSLDGQDDYVDVAAGSGLGLSREITIMAWAAVRTDVRQALVSRWLYGKSAGRSFELDVDLGQLQFGLSADGSKQSWVKAKAQLPTNTWTHVAAVSDGKTMRLFVNGVQDSATATAPSTIHDSKEKVQLGFWNTYSSWLYPLKGRLDEVKIYRKALSAAEIKAAAARAP